MILLYRAVLLSLSFALSVVTGAAAQTVFDRRIPPMATGDPLRVNHLGPSTLGLLAKMVDVPMGIETYSTVLLMPIGPLVTLSGRTLRQALDALVTIDPQYEWREDDGVIVFRHASSWTEPDHPLQVILPPIELNVTNSDKALSLACSLLDGELRTARLVSDTKRFAIQGRYGSTLLDLFNAIVRQHGTAAWGFGPAPAGEQPRSQFRLSLYSGDGGGWCNVASAVREVAALDLSPFTMADATDPADSPAVLDRVVSKAADGSTLVVSGPNPNSLGHLAKAAGVSIGLELEPGLFRPTAELAVSGRTLRDALNAIARVDPRYEWREMDGVIVIRPVGAWTDSESPFFALVSNIRLIDVPFGDAITALMRSLGNFQHSGELFLDSKRVSVDVPAGTVLDLINVIAKEHGALMWSYERAAPDMAKRTGLGHLLTIYVNRSGRGFPVR